MDFQIAGLSIQWKVFNIQRARRSAPATELPSAHVAPPASSVVHAAEPAAALVEPGASTGAHAVEPAAAPATPGASTKASPLT